MAQKILIASPDFPYPPNHGGRVDIWKRMLVLKEIGYDIDLIATVKDAPSESDISKVANVAGNIHIVPREKKIKHFLSWKPHQVMDRAGLIRASLTKDYDHVIVEGSTCELILQNPELKAKNVVVRVHNNEPEYFKNLALSTKNPIKSSYYILESLRFYLSESLLYKSISNYLFISRDELLSFSKKYKDKYSIFLPPAIEALDVKSAVAKENAERRVLFIGSLFMPNNQDGLLWYLNEVHPQLVDVEGYKLVVAGNSKGASLEWLTKHPRFQEIEFHDSPPDLSGLYQNASVFINPMRFGAGMKIKTIEAVCQGLPIVSTQTGAEGTGLEDEQHLYCTDSADIFAQRVRKILLNPKLEADMVERAICYIRQEFNVRKKLIDYFAAMPAAHTTK